MGLQRKSLSFLLVTCMTVGYFPMQVQADTQVDKWCATGARDWLDRLNNAASDKESEIEAIRSKISEANKTQNLLTGITALRDQYLNSLNQLVTPDQVNKTDEGLVRDLEAMKTTIRNGLVISAIKNILANEKLENRENWRMRTICQNSDKVMMQTCALADGSLLNSTNVSSARFAEAGKPTLGGLFQMKPSHTIDPILEDFRKTYQSCHTEDGLKNEVRKILDKIPKDLDPEKILTTIQEKSPSTMSTLLQNLEKKDLMTCLSKGSGNEVIEACKKISEDQENPRNIVSAFSTEVPNLKDTLRETCASTLNEATKQSIADFNAAKEKFSKTIAENQLFSQQTIDAASAKAQKLSIQMSQTTKFSLTNSDELLQGEIGLFYDYPAINDGETEETIKAKKDEAYRKAEIAKNNWNEKCLVPKKETVNECKAILDQLQPRIEMMKSNFITEIGRLTTDLRKIQEDPDFQNIQKLKKYVADKYIGMCGKGAQIKNANDDIFLLSNGQCNSIQTVSTVEILSKEVEDIFTKSKFYTSTPNENNSRRMRPNPMELSLYSSACSSVKTAHKEISNIDELCETISKENSSARFVEREEEKAAQRAAKEAALDDSTWKVYDSSSPSGYKRVKKKSFARIAGEGMLPVVPRLVPAWFSNYQIKNNISMLTQQGIYQKQLLHTYDVYNQNPWMYNYNYFAGSNLYSTTGTSTSTSTGFNFGLGN